MILMSLAFAGPWVKEAGHVYAKAEMSVFAGLATQSAQQMEGQDDMTYNDVRASAYVELGVPAGFQVSGYAPYVAAWNNIEGARLTTLGGGDAQVGLTHALHPKLPITGEIRTTFPTYRDRTARRVERYGPFADGFSDPGDRSVSLEGWAHGGGSWALGPTSGWVQGAAGYRHRFGDFVDAAVFDGVVGLSPKWGWFGLGFGGVINLAPDPVARESVAGRIFGALVMSEAVRLEATTSYASMAFGSSPGASFGLGLSYTR